MIASHCLRRICTQSYVNSRKCARFFFFFKCYYSSILLFSITGVLMIPFQLVPIATLGKTSKTTTSKDLLQSIPVKIAIQNHCISYFLSLKGNNVLESFLRSGLNFLNYMSVIQKSFLEGNKPPLGCLLLPHIHTPGWCTAVVPKIGFPNSISITWELARNANSYATPQSY